MGPEAIPCCSPCQGSKIFGGKVRALGRAGMVCQTSMPFVRAIDAAVGTTRKLLAGQWLLHGTTVPIEFVFWRSKPHNRAGKRAARSYSYQPWMGQIKVGTW